MKMTMTNRDYSPNVTPLFGDQTPSSNTGLKEPPGDGTSGGMDDVWRKLEEHDKALARIEKDVSSLKSAVSHLPTQIQLVWGALVFIIAMAGIVYAVGSYMSTTMATALVAIQTVIAERPPSAAPSPSSPPAQPTVIVVPMPTLQPATPPLPR